MKIKCDLEVTRVVTATDDAGERKETVLRAVPDQEGLEGLSLTVVAMCENGDHNLPPKGTPVTFEMKWGEETP